MTKSNKFSPEVRERAVRMVQEHRGDYPDWVKAGLSCRQFGCKQFDLLDIGRRTEQGRCVGHQGRGDLAV